MPSNPLMTLLGPLRKAPEQEIAESYIDQIGQGDRTAVDPLERFLSAQEETAPFAQRYRDVEDAQTQGAVYGLPEVKQAREDEFERLLAPERVRGEYGLERERIAGGSRIRAAQETGAQRTAQQGATRQGQLQRQRNQLLQQQATQALKQPGPWWFQRLFGARTPEQEAEGILGQQQFGEPETETADAGTLAQQLFAENPGASPDQVAAYAQQVLGLDAGAAAVLADTYRTMQGQ